MYRKKGFLKDIGLLFGEKFRDSPAILDYTNGVKFRD